LDWKNITHSLPQGSILGPLLFLTYINDLPEVLIQNASPILFTDDTSIIVTDSNIIDFQLDMKVTFEQLNNWFNVEGSFTHFTTKNAREINSKLQYENKFIANLSYIKFLVLCISRTMDWRVHIDHLIPNLSSAWYAIRTLIIQMSQEMLIMTRYAYFHSLIANGIIFSGNSPNGIHIFKFQK
jgi:hypothetical protein